MKNSKKWIFISVLFFFLSFFLNVWAQNGDFSTAKNLIEDWFAAMKNADLNKVAVFLAPQFVSIHTDGVVRNKAQEIDLIKNLRMKNYHLTDFKFSRSGNIIVVTYKDKGSEFINNRPIGTQAAGRMAILQKQGNKWVILAYANLDQIN